MRYFKIINEIRFYEINQTICVIFKKSTWKYDHYFSKLVLIIPYRRLNRNAFANGCLALKARQSETGLIKMLI